MTVNEHGLTPVQQAWIDDLRTTTKARGYGRLIRASNSFCCLGVFVDAQEDYVRVEKLNTHLANPSGYIYKSDPENRFLHVTFTLNTLLQERLGLHSTNGIFRDKATGVNVRLNFRGGYYSGLTSLNDETAHRSDISFKDIGDFIFENRHYIFIQFCEVEVKYDRSM